MSDNLKTMLRLSRQVYKIMIKYNLNSSVNIGPLGDRYRETWWTLTEDERKQFQQLQYKGMREIDGRLE